MRFTVDKKSGFVRKTNCLFIAKNNNVFYYRNNKDWETFNLPPGDYDLVEGEFEKLSKPIEYIIENDSAPDFNPVTIQNIIIKVAKNPNKCSVELNENPPYAILDEEIYLLPDFVIDFIIGHEYAHNYYRGHGQDSEYNCDVLAAKAMIVKGYNPCQISAAQSLTLSWSKTACKRRSYFRKKLIITDKNGR